MRMVAIAFRWSLNGEKAKAMAYYSALWWVFFHTSLIVKRRVFVQRIRRRSDDELMKIMLPPAG
jgi:hypothetical protein